MGGEVTRHCGLCGAAELELILDLGLQPLSERHDSDFWYPLMLVRCRVCTLVQSGFMVDPEDVFPPAHPYATGNTKVLVEHFGRLAQELGGSLSADDLVVDIGANDGTLLSGYGLRRLRKVAVEPTAQGLKAHERGAILYSEFFSARLAGAIIADHGHAKVVTATNVLAHVPDPHDFARGVELLADDGVFVTENHDLASVTEGLQIDTVYHEHMRYYSIATLSRLLALHGLSVYRTEAIPTHGGSIRTWASKDRYGGLQGRAEGAAAELRKLLTYATANGDKVYGISATTRATPLIHFARLDMFIDRVCETPLSDKIGQLMPGTKIPIVDESELLANQPEYALLFAWHIAGDLIPKLRGRGYLGKFIIPLPEPEIIDG